MTKLYTRFVTQHELKRTGGKWNRGRQIFSEGTEAEDIFSEVRHIFREIRGLIIVPEFVPLKRTSHVVKDSGYVRSPYIGDLDI